MKYAFLAVLLFSLASSESIAAPKPEDQIRYRQSAMMFMRWNLATIKQQVVVDPSGYNRDNIMAAARAIAAVANTDIQSLFSDGTQTGSGWKPTLVRPEFFQRPDDVGRLLLKLRIEANALEDVARNGSINEIRPQFSRLLQACRSCHKVYRKKPR